MSERQLPTQRRVPNRSPTFAASAATTRSMRATVPYSITPEWACHPATQRPQYYFALARAQEEGSDDPDRPIRLAVRAAGRYRPRAVWIRVRAPSMVHVR